MPFRLIALLLLLAVLPTAEVTEQVLHIAAHVVAGEQPDHSAHHDDAGGDEHGCTGLVHLCGHQSLVTAGVAFAMVRAGHFIQPLGGPPPSALSDLISPEPVHRPPIG